MFSESSVGEKDRGLRFVRVADRDRQRRPPVNLKDKPNRWSGSVIARSRIRARSAVGRREGIQSLSIESG